MAEHAGVFAFTQSFTRDLLTHATWQLKVFFPLAVLAIVELVGWIAGWFGANRPVRRILERERAAAEFLPVFFVRVTPCLLVCLVSLKTLLVQTIARSLDLQFKRIQFTPDLMPSDIVGAETMDKERNFQFVKGPIFANIILADEINRTPPKTQAALLESMQEYAVTIAGNQYKLPKPFFVLATQNPIEQEGTYPLPEAQLDRFMFNIFLDYPSYQQEVDIVKNTTADDVLKVSKVLTADEIVLFQHLVRRVPVADNVVEYAVKLSQATRPGPNGSALANEFLEWVTFIKLVRHGLHILNEYANLIMVILSNQRESCA